MKKNQDFVKLIQEVFEELYENIGYFEPTEEKAREKLKRYMEEIGEEEKEITKYFTKTELLPEDISNPIEFLEKKQDELEPKIIKDFKEDIKKNKIEIPKNFKKSMILKVEAIDVEVYGMVFYKTYQYDRQENIQEIKNRLREGVKIFFKNSIKFEIEEEKENIIIKIENKFIKKKKEIFHIAEEMNWEKFLKKFQEKTNDEKRYYLETLTEQKLLKTGRKTNNVKNNNKHNSRNDNNSRNGL